MRDTAITARISLVALLALAACSGKNNVRPGVDAPAGTSNDAPSNDASNPDAPPGSDATGPVTVTLIVDNEGAVGRTVYFQALDSTVLATVVTDATGTAVGSVGSGGDVTATFPAGDNDLLFTWVGVKPGAHLTAVGAFAVGTVTGVSATIVNAGDGTYEVATTCGATSEETGTEAPTIDMSLTGLHNCDGPQDVEVVDVDTNGHLVGSFPVTSQTFTPNQTLDFTGESYTPAISRTYTWNDYAETGGTFAYADELMSSHGFVYESNSVTSTPPTAAGLAAVAAPYTDIVVSTWNGFPNNHFLGEWGQTGATYTTDWGAHRLADITGETYDAGAKTISLATSGGTAQPNGVELEVVASRTGGHTWTWYVLAPSAPVQVPTLPTDIYDWNIAAADSFTPYDTMLVDVPAPDALGTTAFLSSLSFSSALLSQNTGAAGTVSVTSWTNPD